MKKLIVLLALAASVAGFAAEGVRTVAEKPRKSLKVLMIGNDMTITFASDNGQLELNVMEPVIAYSLFESIHLLANGLDTCASTASKA